MTRSAWGWLTQKIRVFFLAVRVQFDGELLADDPIEVCGDHTPVERLDIEVEFVFQLCGIDFACLRVDDADALAAIEVDAVLAERGGVADGRLVVDQPVICHCFAVAVGVDRLAEDFGGVLGRRGGQADTAGIEVIEHAAVLRQVLRVVAHGQLAFGHFLVERVTAVGLVDDDTVEGADRWRVIGLENAPDHRLHRGDLHAGLIGGAGVVQAIEVVDLRQRLVLLQLHVLHRLGGLRRARSGRPGTESGGSARP